VRRRASSARAGQPVARPGPVTRHHPRTSRRDGPPGRI
jgi:hypothetical protein